MSKVFGHYHINLPKQEEFLTIGFSPSSIPLKQRWRNNGLSADFIAGYLRTFFVGGHLSVHNENAVKYIANELLENAMKFNDDSISQYVTRISFNVYKEMLVFQVTNSIDEKRAAGLMNFINALLASDPQEMYFERMEANAMSADSNHSGLGFLSMICDYDAKLGWAFGVEKSLDQKNVNVVTTMVTLNLA